MKINISKKLIDLEKLDDEISMFESRSNQLAYLFMNQETMDSLVRNVEPFHVFRENNNGVPALYVGRKVYENKDLKFGEVEIR